MVYYYHLPQDLPQFLLDPLINEFNVVHETNGSLVEDLKSLDDLHQQGVLNDEEFNAAKRRLLGL